MSKNRNISCPRRHHAVVLERDSDGFVLTHRETGEKKEINGTGAILWILCDGKNSIDDMREYLRKTCTDVPENVEGEVSSFIQALKEEGFLEKGLSG